jgi:hypothetical protein
MGRKPRARYLHHPWVPAPLTDLLIGVHPYGCLWASVVQLFILWAPVGTCGIASYGRDKDAMTFCFDISVL